MPDGITIEAFGSVFFLPYSKNPWFVNAKISDVFNIEPISDIGVRWDALDVDLAIDSFIHPEKYPLIMKPYIIKDEQTIAAESEIRYNG
jgi:hypothetical protein